MTALDAAGTLRVEGLVPATDPRWALLAESAGGGLFHSPPWFRALAETYGFDIRGTGVADGAGRLVAGVAHCRVSDLLGERLVALPFTDCHDPLHLDPAAWPWLSESLRRTRLPVQLRTIDPAFVPDDGAWTVTKRARWHRITLGSSLEADRARFTEPARRAVRKAERMHLIVRPLEGAAGVAAFHRLHVALRKGKYRLLAQPPAFFESLRRQFEPAGSWHPLGAFLDGRLIAATVYLRWGDTLYYKFNASDPEGLAARPNDLLVDAGLALARSLGCRTLDLGPSDDDQPGLIRFKAGFGAAEGELRFIRHVPEGWTDRGSAVRPMLGALTKLFTGPGVPDAVTSAAGAAFYRFFA